MTISNRHNSMITSMVLSLQNYTSNKKRKLARGHVKLLTENWRVGKDGKVYLMTFLC